MLRNARRLAESSDKQTFFSPTAYTYVPKRTFLDEIETKIVETESKYKELPEHLRALTLLTAIRSQGEYILTFKRGDKVQGRRTPTLSDVIDVLTRAGMDLRSAEQYADQLKRGHAVQVNVDVRTDSIFDENR